MTRKVPEHLARFYALVDFVDNRGGVMYRALHVHNSMLDALQEWDYNLSCFFERWSDNPDFVEDHKYLRSLIKKIESRGSDVSIRRRHRNFYNHSSDYVDQTSLAAGYWNEFVPDVLRAIDDMLRENYEDGDARWDALKKLKKRSDRNTARFASDILALVETFVF